MVQETTLNTETIAKWLSSKNCVMWGGQGWDITDSKESVEAAAWFMRELQSFMDHVGSE
jgi:coproporphyrinogen III oxidase